MSSKMSRCAAETCLFQVGTGLSDVRKKTRQQRGDNYRRGKRFTARVSPIFCTDLIQGKAWQGVKLFSGKSSRGGSRGCRSGRWA